MQSHTSERIRKIIRNNPDMSDEVIARKIGRPDDVERVTKERNKIKKEVSNED
jgi:hypothetical protein